MTEGELWNLARKVMTPKQLDAFLLHARDGLSYQAIALDLGISRQSVVDRVRGGKRRLIKELNERMAA